MAASGLAIRADVGGHQLRVETAGSGPPTFVCLHGLVDTLRIWDPLAGPLAERGRCVRFDQRGHGDSDAPPGPYTREDLVADVVVLLDRPEVGRAILVGHSMGGIVSMATALAAPERVAGLVLLGTASRCSERVAGWYERIARAGETAGTLGLARAIYGEGSKREVTGDAQGIAHVTRTLKSLYSDPLTPKLGALQCPVLLGVGEKDPMGPRASEIIRDQVPQAELRVLAGRGHWTHVEAPEEVLAGIDPWLERHGLSAREDGS